MDGLADTNPLDEPNNATHPNINILSHRNVYVFAFKHFYVNPDLDPHLDLHAQSNAYTDDHIDGFSHTLPNRDEHVDLHLNALPHHHSQPHGDLDPFSDAVLHTQLHPDGLGDAVLHTHENPRIHKHLDQHSHCHLDRLTHRLGDSIQNRDGYPLPFPDAYQHVLIHIHPDLLKYRNPLSHLDAHPHPDPHGLLHPHSRPDPFLDSNRDPHRHEYGSLTHRHALQPSTAEPLSQPIHRRFPERLAAFLYGPHRHPDPGLHPGLPESAGANLVHPPLRARDFEPDRRKRPSPLQRALLRGRHCGNRSGPSQAAGFALSPPSGPGCPSAPFKALQTRNLLVRQG